MFKWIVSLFLIIISLPIIYFNITSFYQAKKDFQQAQSKIVTTEKTDKNITKKIQKQNINNYSSFEKQFDKEWNNF